MLGFMNLYSLRKSERNTRYYNLNMADYEKRRDFIAVNLSEYIHFLDSHELSYMAMTDEEYEGKDLEISKKLYSLETLYYQINLMINPYNMCFKEFSDALNQSILLARKIKTENSIAELLNNGLRTPERAWKISADVLEFQKKETNSGAKTIITIDIEADKKERLNIISEMVKTRDEHRKSYCSAVMILNEQKEQLVTIAQKYLIEEKNQLLDERRKGNKKRKAAP